MQEIIQYQYKLAENLLHYIQSINIPSYGILLEQYKLEDIPGIVYITVFILSLLSWILGRMFCWVFKTHVYNIEKYRISLLFNIFYFLPFIYWFFGGQFRVINIFLLFIWSGFYIWLDIFLHQPDRVIDFFN